MEIFTDKLFHVPTANILLSYSRYYHPYFARYYLVLFSVLFVDCYVIFEMRTIILVKIVRRKLLFTIGKKGRVKLGWKSRFPTYLIWYDGHLLYITYIYLSLYILWYYADDIPMIYNILYRHRTLCYKYLHLIFLIKSWQGYESWPL